MPKKNEHNPINDYQIVDGIYFYKERTGIGYYLGNVPQSDGKCRPVRCHSYVWEKHNGKIPHGYSVHHIDGNPANNCIDNLTLLHCSEHSKYHASQHTDKARETIKLAIPKASEWHKSEQGSEWHKNHYTNYAQKIWGAPITKTCEICGKEYTTNHGSAKKSRFCSNNCRAKFRRMSGIDNETRICSICGTEYVCNKYTKQIVCGNKACANESQRRKKTGVPRPVRSNP